MEKEIPQEYGNQLVSNIKLWRYMDFYKFISLLQFGALWFSKLSFLADNYEGTLPFLDYESLKKKDSEIYEWMGKVGKDNAILSTADSNEKDGRDLTVVNCWNINDDEDLRMWNEYTNGTDGILIRSTLGRLRKALPCDKSITRIDRVKYVDLDTYRLGDYEASQANERALLKSKSFEFENELRILTLNIIFPYCLNDDGTEMNELQKKGPGQYNQTRNGIYIKINVQHLIKKVIISPKANRHQMNLVKGLLRTFRIEAPVELSKFTFA